MNAVRRLSRFAAAALVAFPLVSAYAADEPVLNIYSARHYSTDELLYTNFTKATGIKINRIEAAEPQLLERLQSEGVNSPGDIFLSVDAARLWQAQQSGLLQPVRSKLLEDRIPASLRDPQGNWFAFSYRARAIVYDKAAVNPADVATYEALADPKFKGKVCTRSGSHPYNLSLTAAMIAHHGEAKAEAWAKGVVANLARTPRGGDTDQIKSVAAGECTVALSNSYYFARIKNSDKAEDVDIGKKTNIVWPDQQSFGTHVNIGGAGVLKNAPHRENAVKFLEYLASDEAQVYFANGNNEWPAAPSVKPKNAALESFGTFKIDSMPIVELGRNMAAAQQLIDRVGWK